jgi:hypothetical protein
MPRYFFDVSGSHPSDDPVGEELASDEAAWHEATLVAGEIFRDLDGKFRPGEQWCLKVTGEHHQPVYAIRINATKE